MKGAGFSKNITPELIKSKGAGINWERKKGAGVCR
jgi:hypothetical protein